MSPTMQMFASENPLLPIAYAGLLYWDRTLALASGEISPVGTQLTYHSFEDPGDLFRRQCQNAEFQVSEMSASSYIAMRSRGDDRFAGIPVFPSRNFRHSQVYIHTGSGIRKPQDLAGKRVGILEYQMTAAVWIRSLLQHDYGVKPSDVSWLTGGLRSPEFEERMHLQLPPDVSLRRIPFDRTLEDMLETGELDALVSAFPPIALTSPGSEVSHLFPNYRDVEEDYYRRTHVFPIMHLVVMRKDLYEENPWLGSSLFDAFVASRLQGIRRMGQVTGLAVALPWLESALHETRLLFGGDPFPYGIAKNAHTLAALVRFAFEQGIADKPLDIEDLFIPELHGT
jgi:4,5-dihydroxyphthalate decarboxylase